MKKVIALALVLGLGSCEQFWSSPSSEVSEVQTTAEKLCGFWPQAEAVAQMLAIAASGAAPAGVAIVAGAGPIARAICSAITRERSGVQSLFGSKPSCPQVNGVCIEGEWKEEKER